MSGATVAAATAATLLCAASVIGWQSDAGPAPASARSTLPGAVLFRAKGCSTCHTGPDSTGMAPGPPDLTHARQWAGRRRPGEDAATYLRESIRTPGAFISPQFHPDGGPLTAMPTLRMSAAEVEALVDFLLGR